MGIKVDLKKFNKISDKVPVLVNLKPTGSNYMEDFYYAGGMKSLLKELSPLLNKNCINIEGKSLSKLIKDNSKSFHDTEIIRTRNNPFENKEALLLYLEIFVQTVQFLKDQQQTNLYSKSQVKHLFLMILKNVEKN